MLRLGFGAVLALMIVGALQAWSIQKLVARRSLEISQLYLERNDLLYGLRRVLYLSAIEARDFLISDRPDREAAFLAAVSQFQGEAADLMRRYETLEAPDNAWSDVHAGFDLLWLELKELPQRERDLRPGGRFELIQRNVAPRRAQIAQLLRTLAELNGRDLRESADGLRQTGSAAVRRLFTILSLCIVCGVGVAWFSISRSNRMERQAARQFAAIGEARAHLAELSNRLLEVQERERKQLSRELHDEIGQTLTALRIEIAEAEAAAAGCPDVIACLARARRLAEDTISNVRNVSLLLRPSLLDDLGLGPALQWQAEEFSRRTGIPAGFVSTDLPEDLPETVRTCLYRIAQESLHNVEKHAGAKSVRVAISGAGGCLALIISDDGVGFPGDWKDRPVSGLGILGMRERVAHLGGTLSIIGPPEGGTRIEVTLPLTAGASAGAAAGRTDSA